MNGTVEMTDRKVWAVYTACKRAMGSEYVQDRCLEVFKAVFPEIYRLGKVEQKDVIVIIPVDLRFQIWDIVMSWKPTGKLKKILKRILAEMEGLALPVDDMIRYYEAITPVAMRIRKLTPRETGRLMDLTDEEIDKMFGAGLSNTAMYRLHGNSIVISPMYHIFRKAFVEKERDMKKGELVQLDLF